jgi:peroxiredoxin
MNKCTESFVLCAVIVLAAAGAGWGLSRQKPTVPVAGAFHRSRVDASGHTRGVVQVDLMRQIMASQEQASGSQPASEGSPGSRVPTQAHPLLGQPAAPFLLKDSAGATRSLADETDRGPVVLVFYLGSTCMACMTHLVELDVALPRFREQGAGVLAISADAPELSRDRLRKYGELKVPLLSDPDHAVARAYDVWKPAAGGDAGLGVPLHGTFIVDRARVVQWAHTGDRPFSNVGGLLAEVRSLDPPPQRSIRP